jgi:hypothetical protein
MFSFADEFNLSWFSTLRAKWRPVGKQVKIPTTVRPISHSSIGAIAYQRGENFVLVKRHKRRQEIVNFLQVPVDKN